MDSVIANDLKSLTNDKIGHAICKDMQGVN